MRRMEIEAERLAELLDKERFYDAWTAEEGLGFLIELARQKGFDPVALLHVADLAADISQKYHEGQPLSTAFIMGDVAAIAQALPPGEVTLLHKGSVQTLAPLVATLSELVHGAIMAYAVTPDGTLSGIHKVNIPLPLEGNPLLGPHFRQHAIISQLTGAVVFYVPERGRQVAVFSDGKMVGHFSGGDWRPEQAPHLAESVAEVARRHGFDLGIVTRVFRCALQMSENNLGGLFMLGDADELLRRSDRPRLSSYVGIATTHLDNLTDLELINFARQDGATIVDSRGDFAGCAVLLRPQVQTPADVEPKSGARHTSAAKMSAECRCVAIVISHDGPISVFDCGKRVMVI